MLKNGTALQLVFYFFKVNIDANFSKSKTAMLLVVRDVDGQVMPFLSHFCSCNGPHDAEIRILASKIMKEKNWNNLICSLDDLNFVNEVKAKEDIHA